MSSRPASTARARSGAGTSEPPLSCAAARAMAWSLGEACGDALGAGGSAGAGAAAVVGPVGPVGPVVVAVGGAGTPVVAVGAGAGAGLDFLSQRPRARVYSAGPSASGDEGAAF